jgi:hypothetical protein
MVHGSGFTNNLTSSLLLIVHELPGIFSSQKFDCVKQSALPPVLTGKPETEVQLSLLQSE